jgi:ABC-2 type transport system ATP-binding protein
MKPAVTVKDLSVTLGGRAEALKDVNLELPGARITGLIGPSGAGKTTLARSLVGGLRIPDGSVRIFDLPAGSTQLRRKVAYMSQELSVYPDLTVRENLRYFATMAGQGPAAVKDALAAVELEDKADSLVVDLSGGQKQRVSLAVALLGSPKLMVLDEPTAGLDPVLREKLWKLFKRLAGRGTTLIISSHSMDEANRCDNLVLIRDGSVIAHSSPGQLLEDTGCQTIEESFLKLVGGRE